jgi:6-phosphofructokinase
MGRHTRLGAFVAHGGGPTSVLNASLQGLIEQAHAARLAHLWAAFGGLKGVLRGDTLDLLTVPKRRLAALGRQPGSVIGSSRDAVSPQDLATTVEFFRAHDVRYAFYTGGNGSMQTAFELAAAARRENYELITLGIPKTLDNDICQTDHCPGFGSAARFVATAVREIGLDQRALPTPVSIVEVMGRNTGWLAAASFLARHRHDDPPHFIYVPESAFNLSEFLARVDRLLRRQGWAVGVVAEGLKDAAGRPIAASGGSSRDAKGRPLPGNVAARLASLVSRELKVRARSEKPGLLCRAFSLCRSEVDAKEAYAIGCFALMSALEGKTDAMVAIRRLDSRRYRTSLELVPLSQVAEQERYLPRTFIAGSGGIREAYRHYAGPLIGKPLVPAVSL